MDITEVRVKLLPRTSGARLRGFCSITLDDEFVVRDLKIIEGGQGLFVAMPSRKVDDRCLSCGGKNHLRARYCNDCGERLPTSGRRDGPARHYVDIAHPIHVAAREKVHRRVLEEFEREVLRSREHGYRFASMDDVSHWEEDTARAGEIDGSL